jgi:hypothetical protein
MPTLLADMHLDSIPKSLGGRFTQYNEPYIFDLSVGGPLHSPGAVDVVPHTTTTPTTSTKYNITTPSLIIDCGIGYPVDDTSVNYVENDHVIIDSSKKNDGNTVHNTASLSEDSEDIIITTSTITGDRSNKISSSSSSGSSSSSSSSMKYLNVRNDVIDNNKFTLKKTSTTSSSSSSIELQLTMIDHTMFIVKLLLIITITIILFTIGTNHLK